jgi:hypothetical protein
MTTTLAAPTDAVAWIRFRAALGVAVRARPVLGSAAAVIAWIGFSALAFLVTPDQVALGGVDAGLPTATTATLMSAIDAHPVSSTAAGCSPPPTSSARSCSAWPCGGQSRAGPRSP